MRMWFRAWLETKDAWLNPREIAFLWRIWARPAQTPPEGDWRVWLMMGGRGAGKTRAGAEWVRALVERGGVRRVALVGPTLHDVREVMIEGPSGLKAVAPDRWVPVYEVSRLLLRWPNGAEGHVFSAEDPDSLRGPQFEAAWCDEIGAWARDTRTWDTLMFGLRLGAAPRVATTTTPSQRALVRKLVGLAASSPVERGPTGGASSEGGEGGLTPLRSPALRGTGSVAASSNRVVLTRSATWENARHLSPGFVEAMEESYRGTSTVRQELYGEMVSDPPGALFTRAMIERWRCTLEETGWTEAPSSDGSGFERVVVGVDPPAAAGEQAAACGIVCAGLRRGVVYVLQDASVRGMRPLEWAQRAVAAARRWGAGVIAAEGNQGGEMVRELLHMAGAKERSKVKLVHARESKFDRAQPISGRYDVGEVRHAGVMRELEDEMCAFGAGDAGPSPDRLDALVWAVRELLEKRAVRPRAEWM